MGQRSSGIKSWPEEERPREKLVASGAGALTPTELLAVLLRTGDAGSRQSALDLARGLWSAHGEDWHRLAQATVWELATQRGVGRAKAASLAAAMEIGRRLGRRSFAAGEPYRTSRQVYQHYAAKLADSRKESFFCLLLDTRNRYLREERVSEGTLSSSLVHPREAFRAAVREAASAVIFAHNHPSGDPEPSREDRDLTRRLFEGAKILGIRFLDHVVLGDGVHYSFCDNGDL